MIRTHAFFWLAFLSILLSTQLSPAIESLNETNGEYVVRKAATAPVIDAIRTIGEWDEATTNTVPVRGFRSTPLAIYESGLRWQALYDDEYLYIIVESNRPDTGFGLEQFDDGEGVAVFNSVHILLDPNRDGEENLAGPGQDSYQLWIANIPGTASRTMPAPGPPYITTEARVNSTPGNSGVNDEGANHWNPQGISFARNIVVESGFTMEFAIPFSDLDLDTTGDTGQGFKVTQTPQNGERWFFNLGRIIFSGGYEFYIWSYHPGTLFAQRPFGEIVFNDELGNMWYLN